MFKDMVMFYRLKIKDLLFFIGYFVDQLIIIQKTSAGENEKRCLIFSIRLIMF